MLVHEPEFRESIIANANERRERIRELVERDLDAWDRDVTFPDQYDVLLEVIDTRFSVMSDAIPSD